MNAETEQNINEAINWLQSTAGQIQGFAAEQVPLYCQEVIAWTFWESCFWSGIGLIFAAMGAAFVKKGIRVYQDDPWGDESFFPILGGGMLLLFGVVATSTSAPQAIKAHVAPRLVIIEHLQGITKP